MKRTDITLTVNGRTRAVSVAPRMTLVDCLRDELALTGTHVGCEHGICGCCNILLNDKTARSCLLLAVQLDGAEVRTVESLGTIDDMHPLQEAFWEKHGLQCGFCTPGMLITVAELLREAAPKTRDEIREFLSGNYCRCTGYDKIVRAVQKASS